MAFTKEQLLARLQELHISFSHYEHPVVLTVEAQAKYVGNMKGALNKNLFLRTRNTVLSQRLGLGKGGVRMAPAEALSDILHVPLGCVTPFALVNDQQALNAHDLDKFLISIGKNPAYVDLEANPTVGKDQPPDLANLVPSDANILADPPEKTRNISSFFGKKPHLLE